MDKGEKRKTKKKEKRKEDKWQVRRRGGKGKEASHLEQNRWERRKKEGKKKERSGEGKTGEKRGRKGKRGKREDFPAFRQSKLDGPRIEVGPINESYAWVLKLVGFVKLQEVGVLSYFGYSWTKSHLMAWGSLGT